MMAKTFLLALGVVALVALGADAAIEIKPQPQTPMRTISHAAEFSLCTTCIGFFQDFTGDIINIIADGGISVACSDIANKLYELTGSQAVAEIAGLLCEVAGINEIEKVLSGADLDPIYVCGRLKICPLNTCNTRCVKSVAASTTPSSGPVRTVFETTLTFTAEQNIGTGTVDAIVYFPGELSSSGSPSAPSYSGGGYGGAYGSSGQTLQSVSINEGGAAGTTVSTVVRIDTRKADWNFVPGVYTVKMMACGGDCADQFAGVVFTRAEANFTITA